MIDWNLQFFGGRGASSGIGGGGGSYKSFNGTFAAEDFFYSAPPAGGMMGEWEKKATDAEKSSVVRYTEKFDKEMNAILRNGKKGKQEFQDDINNIKSGANKFNLKEGIVVYRGSDGKLLGGARTLKDVLAKKGAIVQDKGIMSTSVVRGDEFNGKFRYEIKIPKGRGRGIFAEPLSSHPEESEFIVAPGTKFKVTGGKKEGKTIVCQLEAVYK